MITPKINITTSDSCKVLIQDITKYVPEDRSGYGKYEFKYSDTMSVSFLKLNKLEENIIKDYTVTRHINQDDYITLPVKFDGWFTVTYIVLPTQEWFDKELAKTEGSYLANYSIVYYTDGTTFYKYRNGISTAVALQEIIEINPINTTILKTQKDYVSICFLRECYINLCKQIFNSRGLSQCQSRQNIDSELIYKRDLVWMAINVIKYLAEKHSETNPTLSEVQRIIEIITSCNGICPSTSNYKTINNGCGCSK